MAELPPLAPRQSSEPLRWMRLAPLVGGGRLWAPRAGAVLPPAEPGVRRGRPAGALLGPVRGGLGAEFPVPRATPAA